MNPRKFPEREMTGQEKGKKPGGEKVNHLKILPSVHPRNSEATV